MKSLWAWFVALATVGLSGCEYNQYELDLRANGPKMERQLTCWRVREKGNNEYELNRFSTQELNYIGKPYAERLSKTDSAKQTFRGNFENAMPNDVGGSGSYTFLSSSLGTTASYAERFRGNDDIDSQFYDKRQVADRMVDLLLGWLETEMGQDPVFPTVRKLIHQDVRQDFRNIGLYVWLANSLALNHEGDETATGNPEPWTSTSEIFARVRQYLVERNYLQPHETLSGLQAEIESAGGQGHIVVKRVFAYKLGLTDPEVIQRALGFFDDEEKVKDSITKYLETTPEFERRLKHWEVEKKTNASASRPNSNEILSELTFSLLEIEIGNRLDKLQLTLKVPVPPYQTNGEWNAGASCITWSKSLRKSVGLPALCVASWDEPDTKFQTAHLGRVLLQGKDLFNYNIWRRVITPAQGTQWDNFLAGLKPGKNLADVIAAFEYTGDAKPKVDGSKINPPPLGIQGRDIVVEALKKEE